jgi:predicted CXXCH cytochrome family protein
MCLGCHGDKELSVALPSGEKRSLYIDQEAYTRSVHGDKLGCADCHPGMTEVPHPARPFKTLRDFTIAYYEACKRCHFANYTKTLDSVHYSRIAQGDPRAPLCVDCHTAHAVTRPDVPRSRISQTCANCHREVSAAYATSVHGRALLEEENRDVPVCTDCHRAHNIADPRAPSFHLGTPELCGNCHANERLIAKYGLSTKVLQTYLADFHGMTASLYRARKGGTSTFTAVCTDCHGVHDITKVRDPASRVMQANLAKVCRQCHPGATESFPAAWLSHYEPSWKKAPLVYAVKLFYLVFIPFVVGGLLLQILLHLWRVVVNR